MIRFTNDEVMKDIPDVIGRIHRALMAAVDGDDAEEPAQG